MKIAGKIVLIATSLCMVGAVVCVGLTLHQRNHVPGKYGRNLEFRVSALNTENFDQFSRAPEGFDVFSGRLAREISESGVAPAGFEWLPLSNFDLNATGGVEPRGITRVINGREFLLVANRPEMMLTHGTNDSAWGVKSVEITATYKYGPVVKAVEIKLDDAGGDLLRQFTQKYVRHSIATIVDGQVIANFGLLTPITKHALGLRFPVGGEPEAEKLRDTLM